MLDNCTRPPSGAGPKYATRTVPPREQFATNPPCACTGATTWSAIIVSSQLAPPLWDDATATPALIAPLKDELISAARLGATIVAVNAAVGVVGVPVLEPPPQLTDTIATTTTRTRVAMFMSAFIFLVKVMRDVQGSSSRTA